MAYGKYSVGRDFSLKKSNPNNDIPIDINLLKNLLEITGPSGEEDFVRDFILQWIKKEKITCKYTIDKNGNVMITKGEADIYPCVVAHMDEVCGDVKARRIIELDNVLVGVNPRTGEWAGCPGDDRVGCYVALEMLHRLPACKIAFFVEEEVGATAGSKQVRLDFFSNCAFIFQVDRAGDNEFIIHSNGGQICSDAFQTEIKWVADQWSYRFSDGGTFTDCGVLASRDVGVCCINFGAGYFDNHSFTEKVCITAVENVLNIVHVLCIQYGWKQWTNKFAYGYANWGYDDDYGAWPAYGKNYGKNYTWNKYTQTVEEEEDETSWRAELMDHTRRLPAAKKSTVPIEEVDFDYADLETLPCNSCKTFDCLSCPYAVN